MSYEADHDRVVDRRQGARTTRDVSPGAPEQAPVFDFEWVAGTRSRSRLLFETFSLEVKRPATWKEKWASRREYSETLALVGLPW